MAETEVQKLAPDLPPSNPVDSAPPDSAIEKSDPASNDRATAPEEQDTPQPIGEKETSSTEKKEPSKRVQEGRNWNNRDRERKPTQARVDYRKNIKTDFTAQKESSDLVEIRKQVEFYFSDSNLLQDNFLFEKVQGHDNLPVPISVIHSFKRMRHFQPLSAVIAALKESGTLNVVDNDEAVQRKVPLPETTKGKSMDEIKKVAEDDAMRKSVYAKGFGDEEPTTQFDIEAFFAGFGTTNSVRLRRHPQKQFKGSVFVEFDSEESQSKFLTLDPPPKWKGKELIIKSKKQYCDEKVDDINSGRIKPKQKESRDRRNNGTDDRDWRVRRNEDAKHGKGGRGGASRGRGGRGSGRGNHHDRKQRDRKDDTDQRNVPKVQTTTQSHNDEKRPATEPASAAEATKAQVENNGATTVTTAASLDDATTQEAPSPSKKRARENDDDIDTAAPLTKKIDVKESGKSQEEKEAADGQAVEKGDS
ncbi:MAG: hypothetical protein Q9190_004571 [Brigantiaea leucoxantha]